MSKLPCRARSLAPARHAARVALIAGLVLAAACATTVEPAAAQGVSGASTSAAPGRSAAASAPNPAAVGVAPLCADAVKPGQARCYGLLAVRKGVSPYSATPQGYGPADITEAYNLPSGGGAGATIAVVDAFDNPNAAADLAVYRSTFGLPALRDGQLRKVSQRGTTTDLPAPDAGWAGEIALDLDAVSAVAPQADILLVEADSPSFADLGAAVNTAVSMGAKYVSNSYGSDYTSGSGEDAQQLQIEKAFYDHPGVAVVASTGDFNYGVSFPASSQYVTAAGGTTLTRDTTVARAWTEQAWGDSTSGYGAGSGCSAIEPKPAFQTDTGCAKRAVADVSMVADPATGLAVYNTYQEAGWVQAGGTSLSSPLIAATYALAGAPQPGTYPNSYPYASSSQLHDVVGGSNGTCAPTYLCTAVTGYDGPTGLGTPDGVGAFATPIRGVITGTVTDARTARPVVGATVTAGSGATAASTSTGTGGTYRLFISPGSYRPTVAKFGYRTRTLPTVTVARNRTVRANAALTELATHTVSGTVSDGSGHGWALYSQLTFAGVPNGTVFTDPFTGRYRIELPVGLTTRLTVAPVSPGYTTPTLTLTVGSTDQVRDIAVPVDASAMTTPGYSFADTGAVQRFSGSTAPAGWTVTNLVPGGASWTFDDPNHLGNLTPGSGGFASIDSDAAGADATQNATLTSPVVDMTRTTSPTVTFDSAVRNYIHDTSAVELSVDGGRTWNVVERVYAASSSERVALPSAAGRKQVQVRFHYQAQNDYYWEIDNVRLGGIATTATPGGLLTGVTSDATTEAPLDNITVSTGRASTTSIATGDPALPHGYYALFAPYPGGTLAVTARHVGYTQDTVNLTVAANTLTRHDFDLRSGRATVVAPALNVTVPWQGRATRALTVRNTGTAPVTVQATEGSGSFTLAPPTTGTGAAVVVRRPTTAIAGSLALASRQGRLASATASAPPAATPSADGGWSTLPDIPVGYIGNTAATYNGKVYSFGGYAGSRDNADLWVYDTGVRTWTELTPAATPRESATVVARAGKLYVVGGLTDTGVPAAKVEIYDIASDTWTTGPTDPHPSGGAGFGVVDDTVYMVGGCTSAVACDTGQTETFDLTTGRFGLQTPYPDGVSFASCGGIDGKLYCAGGAVFGQGVLSPSPRAYLLDPSATARTWQRLADMPDAEGVGSTGAWGAVTATANGQLLMGGGDIDVGVWNGAYSYNPASDSWIRQPNLPTPVFRGGGAVGWFAVGGSNGYGAITAVNVLPQFNQSETSQVSWMTETTTPLTIAPGKTASITVTLDGADPTITQPGTYRSSIGLITDSPYTVPNTDVSFTVKAPETWGEITGTVTGTRKGITAPLAGATVRINTWAASYTLTTATDGTYALYLDQRSNPLQVIVAKDGYIPQVDTVAVRAGATTTHDVALDASG